MEKLKILEQKVKELVEYSKKLKIENEKILAELKYLEAERENIKKTKLVNETLENQKKIIKEKITKLLEKFAIAKI